MKEIQKLRSLPTATATLIAVAVPLLLWGATETQQEVKDVVEAMRVRLATEARTDDLAFERLAHLCDQIGPRPAGSPAYRRAAEWTASLLRADGQENVRLEPVTVPVWRRGRERCVMLSPAQRELPILGLGPSVGTPGLEGEVFVAHSFDDLGPQVEGKIVLFNVPMNPGLPSIRHYGPAVQYRAKGAAAAARHGAIAMLLRSVTTRSLATPHTGMQRYEDGVAKIPAAALTTEDADWIDRASAAGLTVTVRLEMDDRSAGEATDHNVVAEIVGSELPDEIVLVGGHLDSWDVGQGAHDDGAGVIQTIETLRLIRALPERPRRTIRAVLFADEEMGLYGGKAYAAAHAGEHHTVAVESDLGGTAPMDWGVVGSDEQVLWFLQRASAVGLPVRLGGGGSDISALKDQGVLLVGLHPDDAHYFDLHHTNADTLDKIDPAELRDGLTAVAQLVWQLAN